MGPSGLGRMLYSTTTPVLTFHGHNAGQPALAGNPSYKPQDFVGEKFYCPHALVDGI